MITYMVFATQRSGHHAVINWLASNSYEYVLHYNDLSIEEYKKSKIIKNGRKRNFLNVYKNLYKPGVNFIFNWEGAFFSERIGLENSLLCKGRIIPLIVIRDFYNMIASSLKNTKQPMIIERKNVWIEHAKAILQGYDYINYNEWVKSETYREKIAHKYNLRTHNKGLSYVPDYGGGSSFDKLNYQNKGNQMDVLNRWKKFKDDKRYLNLLDSDVAVLNKKIFG